MLLIMTNDSVSENFEFSINKVHNPYQVGCCRDMQLAGGMMGVKSGGGDRKRHVGGLVHFIFCLDYTFGNGIMIFEPLMSWPQYNKY